MSANTSKRSTAASAGPKPPTNLGTGIIIADTAVLIGKYPIKIGANSVIHPRARIVSTYGPVTIGENCIICERAAVGIGAGIVANSTIDKKQALSSTAPLIEDDDDGVSIMDACTIEAGAVIEAKVIGECTIIEVNAKIGKGAVLGKNCKITPFCEVNPVEILPDRTVIFETINGIQRRTDESGTESLRKTTHLRHIDVLRRLIPSNPAKFTT